MDYGSGVLRVDSVRDNRILRGLDSRLRPSYCVLDIRDLECHLFLEILV